MQPILIDFIKDPFISELLPNITQYITLAREKEYQRHAFEKAKQIVTHLDTLINKC